MWKSKFCSESGSGWGSWYYFGFQYQTYITYLEDTHQILFGSVNSFKSYCVHMKSPRTYVHPDIQTDRQTEIFFSLFCLLRHKNHVIFKFFSQIFFFKIWFLRALHSMLFRLQRQNGLYVYVLWKIWYTASGRNWTLVSCDKVLLWFILLTSHSAWKLQFLPRNG